MKVHEMSLVDNYEDGSTWKPALVVCKRLRDEDLVEPINYNCQIVDTEAGKLTGIE